MQELDLELGLHVDLKIVLRLVAIDILLPVLAHHDERGRVSGLERERQVEQDKRVGIPLLNVSGDVEDDPDQQIDRLNNDESSEAHIGG
jgi:hypothetical protein